MSDDTTAAKDDDNIEDAVIVEEPHVEPVAEPEAPEPVTVVLEEPIVEPAVAPQQVVYVQTPPEPKKRGNRLVGSLIAVASGVVFAAVLALATAIIGAAVNGRFSFAFLGSLQFYFPVIFFIIGFVLLVLIANRATWWAYIFGSILVAIVVYFGTIGLGIISAGGIMMTPTEAAELYRSQLVNPFVIVATLLARETALWFGSLISRRARSVKARNAQARADYEQVLAEKRAEREQRGASATATL